MNVIVPLAQAQCLLQSRHSAKIRSLGLSQSLFSVEKPTGLSLGERGAVAGRTHYLSAAADYPKCVPDPEYDSSPYSTPATENRGR